MLSAVTRLPLKTAFVYVLICSVAVSIFWLICLHGETLHAIASAVAGSRATRAAVAAEKPNVLPHLLLSMLAVLLAARLVSWVFARWRQPPVMGEVVAGIILGPSALGLLWPQAETLIFPPAVVPYLAAVCGMLLVNFIPPTFRHKVARGRHRDWLRTGRPVQT